MKTPNEFSYLVHHFLFIFSVIMYMNTTSFRAKAAATHGLLRGFTAAPDSSISSFQPLLTDPTDVFSFGFLRVERSQLALAVLHVPSSEPVWQANTRSSISWSKDTKLSFNGSLVLSDSHKRVIWSTESDGDRLLLLNNSNLQIQRVATVVWQSFDFPSDTLLENQNFTASMSLVSSNGIHSMRLGEDYLGLYSKVNTDSKQIYWKHKAMEAKADIVDGEGPIYAKISSNGYLGMYQTTTAPVDVLPFDSFQRPIPGIQRLRLESDGNLRGYYWNGTAWISNFQAIPDSCELPSSCGFYGLCRAGSGCSCLDNRTEYHSGECFPPSSGDFCSKQTRNDFWVLRRRGVELPYKELMEFQKMGSLADCENSCETNCSCWGAVYNNASGYCYKLDYPINTLMGVGDLSKVGYFKVRNLKKKREVGVAVGVSVVVGVALILLGVAGFGIYRILRRKQREARLLDDGLSPGSYKDLGSASFSSMELCRR